MRGLVRFLRGNTIALLALFIALSGTTYAAATSLAPNSVGTTQLKNGAVTKKKISKRTIAALKGNRGPRGIVGARGDQGPKGDKGDSGPAGPLLQALPSGKTLTGAFGGASSVPPGVSESAQASFSYPVPLATNPAVNRIQVGGGSTANCPGSLLAPKAAPGNLCLYLADDVIGASSTGLNSYGVDGGSDYKFGGVAYIDSSCTPPCFTSFSGTWAVTAP
jgi:hypothetical protein